MIAILIAMLILPITTAVDTHKIDNELVYTIATSCESITNHLPNKYELVGLFLPNDKFDGEISLTKNEVDSECMLHLRIQGEFAGKVDSVGNVFELASEMNHKLKNLVEAQYLRGSEETTQDLRLHDIHFTLNKRDYAIHLQPNPGIQENRGEITLNGGNACKKLTHDNLFDSMIPNGMVNFKAVKMHLDQTDEVSTTPTCALSFNLVAQVPQFDSNDAAFTFLETIDNNVKDYFSFGSDTDETKAATLSNFTMLLFTQPSIQLSSVGAASLRGQATNLPTKGIAMGILMGMVLLGMMLLGMTYQKKKHDQHCQERYHNASRVAQIYRVSHRMGYGRVPLEEDENADIL